MSRFVDNTFPGQDVTSTIGEEFKVKQVQLGKYQVTVKLIDTAGQERFGTITSSFYRGSDGIIIVYDVADERSLKSAEGLWFSEMKRYAQENVCLAVMGNKIDLEDRAVDAEAGQAMAEENSALFFEVSAKTGANVEEAFLRLTCDIVEEKSGETIKLKDKKLNLHSSKKKKGGRCII
ncbi:activation of store-operated calcium channel [Balamuthia mandrillaris]